MTDSHHPSDAPADGQSVPEPAAPDRAASDGRQAARSARMVVSATLALLVVGGAVLLGVQGVGLAQDRREAAAREQVLTAARQEAVDFLSLSFDTFDDDTKAVLDGATGDFYDSWKNMSATLKPQYEKIKLQTRGEALAAGLSALDSDTASAVVVANQTAQAQGASGEPVQNRYRLAVSLNKVGGSWKVSAMSVVPPLVAVTTDNQPVVPPTGSQPTAPAADGSQPTAPAGGGTASAQPSNGQSTATPTPGAS